MFWRNKLPPSSGSLNLVRVGEVIGRRKSVDWMRKAARTVANLNYRNRSGDKSTPNSLVKNLNPFNLLQF
jgi:hypothetical protein